ncbi:MAG TPA: citrate/2-methylcitrate synthase [Kofleriaceae bacterium]|nr:citrate/2-methylcitrate synthase [Kofleriaceae bacterium]
MSTMPARSTMSPPSMPPPPTTPPTHAMPASSRPATDPAVAADVAASLHDAGAVHVPPWMAVVAGLASARPDGFAATVDWVVANRAAMEQAYEAGRSAKLGLARLPPELRYQPELGFLDFGRRDHALRDRYLFADVVGQRTFFQTAIYAMTGVELPPRHASMLEQMANATLQADVSAWPLAVTRRVAARGGDYASAVLGGMAMMSSPVLAGAAAADCARFLLRVDAAQDEGRLVADVVTDVLARRERVMGFGRPFVPVDERVEMMQKVLVEYGRDHQPFVTLLREVEAAFIAQKGLRTSAAAWAAAILLDFGMTPVQVQAVSNFWVTVCVYSHAVYAGERGVNAAAAR